MTDMPHFIDQKTDRCWCDADSNVKTDCPARVTTDPDRVVMAIERECQRRGVGVMEFLTQLHDEVLEPADGPSRDEEEAWAEMRSALETLAKEGGIPLVLLIDMTRELAEVSLKEHR